MYVVMYLLYQSAQQTLKRALQVVSIVVLLPSWSATYRRNAELTKYNAPFVLYTYLLTYVGMNDLCCPGSSGGDHAVPRKIAIFFK